MNHNYLHQLQQHYESYFKIKGNKLKWPIDSQKKIPEEFYILEFEHNPIHSMWTYCTVGMSINNDTDFIELFVFSPQQDRTIVELLTIVASFHINDTSLDLNHTVNIGRPWLPKSLCDYGLISLPYLDGRELELFSFNNNFTHCYWFVPITKAERDYKIRNGVEALEQIFEDGKINFINPARKSLV